jgi:hypothetical protein
MSSFSHRKVDGSTDRWECESSVGDPELHHFGKTDLDPHQNEKPFSDPHQSQNSGAVEPQIGAMEGRGHFDLRPGGTKWRPGVVGVHRCI